MWKTSDVRKLLVWFFSIFEEESGKASTKRILAVILGLTSAYIAISVVRHYPTSEWTNSIGFLITIFTFIGSLLALGTIPWKSDK